MKTTLSILLTFFALAAAGQEPLVPGKNSFERNRVKSNVYQMTWYGLKDTTKIEIGEVTTRMIADRKYLTIVTNVKLRRSPEPWVDTTIAEIATLKPVRHTSTNMQRDMVLHFGSSVTGYYNDKIKTQNQSILDTPNRPYFDSNIYPYLLCWLPLSEGYTREISIYDYNPGKKTGVLRASVTDVRSGTYTSKSSGVREVWVLTATDEIASGSHDYSTYFIDKADRRLWKQEVFAGGRMMLFVRKE